MDSPGILETEQVVIRETQPQKIIIVRESHLVPYLLLKSSLDMILSLVLLVCLAPLIGIIALFIKADSKGPVLFVQERVGCRWWVRDGKVYWEVRNFRIYKFRSMYHNADQLLHRKHIQDYVAGKLSAAKSEDDTLKLTSDPRITRVGHFLRKTSLDELPQLFNVLKGEMSLVGPRPVPVYEYESYEPWHRERLSALPGMTGLWQVEGRCLVSFDEQINMDIQYARNQSLWLDMKLLFLTIPAVISGRGAG